MCADLREDADQKANTFGIEIRDDDGEVNGISLNYRGGSTTCVSDPTQIYWLTVNITCNADAKDLATPEFAGDACHPTLVYAHESGCAVIVFDKFTQFINKYSYLWGAALILLGVFLAFFGNKFVNVVIFTVVALGVFVIIGSLFFQLFLKKVKEEWAQWLCAAAIIAVSCGAGWGVMRMRKYGIGLVAGWGGVMIGFVLTAAFLVENVWAYWAIIAGCAVAAFYLAIKVEKTVIIIITAFVGAYAIIRGVSMYVGGFPNEMELRKELADGVVDWDNYDKKFYIYLGAILVTTILGTIYQRRQEESLSESLRALKKPIR